jgi:hypothetical protein
MPEELEQMSAARRVGPDIQPEPVYMPPPVQMQMPAMQSSGPDLGQSLGQLSRAGFSRLRQTVAPDLKSANPMPTASAAQSEDITAGLQKALPDAFKAGGEPAPSLKPRGKFLGLFGEGGRLRRPGDVALVGDDPARGQPPTEAVVNLGDGQTEVVPFTRLRRVMEEQGGPGPPPAPYEAPTVPMTGRVRAQPAPGEEAANDARFARVLERVNVGSVDAPGERVGGDLPPADLYSESGETRPRLADRPRFLRDRIADIEANPTHQNSNGRLGGALKAGGRLALNVLAQGGNPVQALGAFATGTGIGAFDKSFDERLGEQGTARRMRGQLAELNQQETDKLKLEDARAGVRFKKAQAVFAESRPDIERGKREDGQAKAERARIFGVLARLKGQPLDPNNPRIQKLQQDADAAGIPFDVDSFNDSRGNVVRYTKTDPEHPEQTVEVERNVVTGEENVLGHKGYQATRDATGRTAAEVKADEDRDAARANTEAYRKQLLGLSTERLRAQLANGLSGAASRKFNVETKGLFERRRQIETQIQGYNTRAAKAEISGAERDRRVKELTDERDKLTGQIDDARSGALGSMSAAPAAAPPVTHRMSRALFRKNNPQYASASDADVDAVLRANGMQGY